MAVTCPVCRSSNTQSLVDRYQCLDDASHQFLVDGTRVYSDAYPADDSTSEPQTEAEPESAKKGRFTKK